MMPQIRFVKNFEPIEVEDGANLMFALLTHHKPVASSCQGDGVCCKCLIEVLEGKENLSIPNPTEESLRYKHQFGDNFRVSCQTQVFGDILIDTKYW